MKKSPKKTIKKKATINDLAGTVGGLSLTVNNLVQTVDDLARMVARGFEETKAELRVEFREGFEKVNHRLDVHIAQTAEGFENVDKRFDALEAGTHRRITLVESTVAGMMKREVKK